MSDDPAPRAKRPGRPFLCGVICTLFIVGVLRVFFEIKSFADAPGGVAEIAETVTIKWSDALEPDGSPRSGGQARYGIHVYVTPRRRDADPGPYKVHAACYIGPPGPVTYMEDIGVIGRASDWGEANEKFGVVRFTPDGAYIGDGLPAADGSEDDYLYPTSRMINHR